jgi:hypothetical protein
LEFKALKAREVKPPGDGNYDAPIRGREPAQNRAAYCVERC